MSGNTQYAFASISPQDLETMSPAAIDDLPFGVVGFAPDTSVLLYNETESRLAGLPTDSVMGEPYFLGVAQCMNNYMIAQRFEDEAELDVVMDYVLTLRMRPTPVSLRLLKQPSCPMNYVLIQR